MEIESKRSCYSRERCCCIPTEKLSFVFAIINAVSILGGVVVGLSVLGSLVYTGVILNTIVDPSERRAQNNNSLFHILVYLCIVCCVATLIAATFAIILCIGLCKKNSRYVMAYLVYGIVVEVLSVGAVLAFIAIFGHIDYASIFLVVCVVYAFMLLLVYRTYVALSYRPLLASRKLIDNSQHC